MTKLNDILLIGGPAGIDINKLRIDRIPCTVEGLLAGSSFRRYRAIVYWPNDEIYTMPGKARWENLHRKDPQNIPCAPTGFWEWIDSPPDEVTDVDWSFLGHGRSEQNSLPNDKNAPPSCRRKNPRYSPEDCAAFKRRLEQRCIQNLWALLLAGDEGVLVVSIGIRKTSRVPPNRYLWLSRWYMCVPGADRKVTLSKELLDDQSITAAFFREYPLDWAVGANTKHEVCAYEDDPEYYAEQTGQSPWRGHLLENDDEMNETPVPTSIRGLGLVNVLGAHVSDLRQCKTLFFKSGKGGVAVIPEPPSAGQLVRLVRAVLEKGVTADEHRLVLTGKTVGNARKFRKRVVMVGNRECHLPELQFYRLLCLIIAEKLPQQVLDLNEPRLGDFDVTNLCWINAKTKSAAKFASEVNRWLKMEQGGPPVVRADTASKSDYKLRPGLSWDVSGVIAVEPSRWPSCLKDLIDLLNRPR